MRNFLAFLICFFVVSCSSVLENEKLTYTLTDGLSLKYEMQTQTNGILIINRVDSILFNYKLSKKRIDAISAKTLKNKKIAYYEYEINYLNFDRKEYPILLRSYTTLFSSKREKVFRFEEIGSISKK